MARSTCTATKSFESLLPSSREEEDEQVPIATQLSLVGSPDATKEQMFDQAQACVKVDDQGNVEDAMASQLSFVYSPDKSGQPNICGQVQADSRADDQEAACILLSLFEGTS